MRTAETAWLAHRDKGGHLRRSNRAAQPDLSGDRDLRRYRYQLESDQRRTADREQYSDRHQLHCGRGNSAAATECLPATQHAGMGDSLCAALADNYHRHGHYRISEEHIDL